MDCCKLTNDKILIDNVMSLVNDEECGAVSFFVGTTRDHFEGKRVVQLEYEAYQEMAEKEMLKLCTEARKKWTLKHVAIFHRLGVVPVKESSVIVAVSSVHRRESLDAVSFLIDSLKASVPIWKREVYQDGDLQELAAQKQVAVNTACYTSMEDKWNDVIHTSEIETNVDMQITCSGDNKNEEEPTRVDPNLVQIVTSKSDLLKRIRAFQQRKRDEIDILNIQEFCLLSGNENSHIDSCARTSAILIRSKGSKSHLKLTNVVNEWGPQTIGERRSIGDLEQHQNLSDQSHAERIKSSFDPRTNQCNANAACQSVPFGMKERLENLEVHLHLTQNGVVPPDVYVRLKLIEDRLLYLESVSPEYFNKKHNVMDKLDRRKPEIKAFNDDMSVDDLDHRIYELKMKLKKRQLNCSNFF